MTNKEERFVDLSNIPKTKKGGINWKESVGKDVYFKYGNLTGYIHIVGENGNDIIVSYNGKTFNKNKSNFKNGKIGNIIGVISTDFKYNIGDIIKDDKRDYTIINREHRKKERIYRGQRCVENRKWYLYHCNKCGYEDWMIESNIKSGNGCVRCRSHVVTRGINDISTTDPWMVNLFENIEDAYNNTSNSHNKANFKCPHCGEVHVCIISNIYKRRKVPCMCNKNRSYPEKIMYNVLKQLNLKFKTQYNKSDNVWCGKYKYDFYLSDYNMIIETHGRQHYDIGFYREVEKEQENDRLKKELALKNGIKEYIEINCSESNLIYIKSSILSSKLSEMFELNKINWDEVGEYGLSNIAKEVCEYYNENKNKMYRKDIIKKFDISYSGLRSYLKKGYELGWIKEEDYKGLLVSKKVKIKELGLIFDSLKDVKRYLDNKYDINVKVNSIGKVCRGEQKSHKGFHFEYVEVDE